MKLIKYWPIILIFLVWFVFSYKFIILGKVPFPSDYLVNNFAPWNAYPGFAGPVKNAATPDVISQIFPWKSLVIESWKQGIVPLWNPYSFSGTPLLANYQSAALSPFNLIYLILPFITAWSLQVLLAPLLSGLFTFLFLRTVKVSTAGSVVSAIAFMFCGFITTWMDYGTLPYAILFLPLALYAVEQLANTKKWYFLVLLTLTVPLSFFSGHFQISLYFLIFIFAYIVFKYFQTKNLYSLIFNLSSLILGLMLSAPQLLPSFELYSNAVRSSLFLKIEDIPWGYLATFVAPDYLGNPVTRNDWFGHYAEWNAYIGLVPLMLAFYSLGKKSLAVLFFLFAGLSAILFSFQSPIVDLLIALKIPVLSTSAVGRIIVLFSFSFAVLAGFGFDAFVEDVKKGSYRMIAILFASFFVIFAILGTVAFSQLLIPQDKAQVALSNLKLPAVILFVFFVASLITSFFKGARAVIVISVIVLSLTSFDMVRFANKWMPFQSASLVYPAVPVSKFLNKIPSENRVFGNFGAESYITHRISGVDGYDPLFISRYGELLNSAQDGLFHTPDRLGVSLPKRGEMTPKLVNLLGVKYFVNKIADGRQSWAFPIWQYPIDQFKIVFQDEAYQVFENQKVLPRVFLVSDYKIQTNKRKILKDLYSEGFDPKKGVILEESPGLSTSEVGRARIISYQPNKVRIEAESSTSALLVLTDPYYPGWKATVNGNPTKIYRADYALRAVKIPKGKNSLIFSYEPESFRNGVYLAVLGVFGLIGISLYASKRFRKS